ncbi:MAG: GGDEF domain-containing protein [Campylobacterota bacterium]|nr:GGDEF domain-containing protein [Campylobacterota bacterium]
MRFPLLGEIATKDVISISSHESAALAVEKMVASEHRNIVVEKDGDYYLMSAIDALSVKSTYGMLDITIDELDLAKMQTMPSSCSVLEVLNDLPEETEYICVTGEKGELVGLITHTDIISNIDPETMMENYRLKDFLKMKRRTNWVGPNEITEDVLTHLANNDYDNVVVIAEEKPIGILTTKDVIRLVHAQSDLTLSIEHYMSSPVEMISNDVSVKEAMEFIRTKHYKRIIVVKGDGTMAGVISQKELISLSYGKWATLMKESQNELKEINRILEQRSYQYEKLASTDALTGLYNRYKFNELYVTAYKTKMQRQNALSLILLDIDHFKQVNDRFGHNVGDRVLVQIAHVLLHQVRSVDIVGRWGGEEFIILLPTADVGQAAKLAEKLRVAIAEKEIELVGHVYVSLGVTEIVSGDMMESAVERADKALYSAKEGGRNRVEVLC